MPFNERVERLKRRYWPYVLLAVYIGSFAGMSLAIMTLGENLVSAIAGGLGFAACEVAITLIIGRINRIAHSDPVDALEKETGRCPANEGLRNPYKKGP